MSLSGNVDVLALRIAQEFKAARAELAQEAASLRALVASYHGNNGPFDGAVFDSTAFDV